MSYGRDPEMSYFAKSRAYLASLNAINLRFSITSAVITA